MSGSVVPQPSTPLTRAVIVVLTSAALLLGVLAMHCMTGSHSDASLSAGHTHAESGHADTVAASTGGMALAAGTDHGAVVPTVPCDDSCAMGCALMAATCVLVFFLASLILLARVPAMFARVLDAGPRLLRPVPRAKFHVYLPSLTVLSISRT
jgi:protein-S-isoprenylcysteine O-methyltransferase Ste14